jgi:hypothetical protein
MNRRKRFVSTGILSLFLIFTVFCMVILTLMAYRTSRMDVSDAKDSLAQSTAYYETCSHATDLCLGLEDLAETVAADSSDAENFAKNFAEALAGETDYKETVQYDAGKNELSFSLPFSDTQSLYVSLSVSFQTDGKAALSLKSWKTSLIGEWNPNLHQNVYTIDE